MLADAWLKVVSAFTPQDMKLLKAQGCASELFVFLEAFDKLTLAWRRTQPGAIGKKTWDDVQIRLEALWVALHEG